MRWRWKNLNRRGRRVRREQQVFQRCRMTQQSASVDTRIYILGAVLGVCAGVLDVMAGDLLLTALFVLCSTMLLGGLRPERPWRWILTVGMFVPVVQLLAYAFLTQKPYPAQIYESC